MRYVCKVLARLWRFSLYANLDKYKFFILEVDFLSFIVSKDSVHIDLEQVKAIAN